MVLSHRVVVGYKAIEDKVTSRDIIEQILEKIPAP